jgi:hypothetical protein
MKKPALFLLLLLTANAAAAQDIPLNMNYGRNRDVELRLTQQGEDNVLMAEKRKPGMYTVYVEFDRGVGRSIVMRGEQEEVLRMKAELVFPSFRFSYFPGWVNSRPRMDFVYRLPFGKDAIRRAAVSTRMSDEEKKHYENRQTYRFVADRDDDVYAMRKGEVVDITDTEWTMHGVANDMTLRRANKLIVVEHRDGTRAHYIGVQDGTVTVEVGDTVYPETVLGKAGTLTGEEHEIRVSIEYVTAPLVREIPDFRLSKQHNIDALFLTSAGPMRLVDDGMYGCVVTDDLATAEMTKREKKGRGK